MSSGPVIAFGQQPCGIFPKRFLVAKILTARRLQQELGGEIVFFYHDSDHDPRETRTILRHRKTGAVHALNFTVADRLQRRFTPLYLKPITPEWHATTARQLPAFVPPELVEMFKNTPPTTVADFCLGMYRHLGLLAGVRVARSSDPAFRAAACAIDDCYVDVPYGNTVVRARRRDGDLCLHEGGNCYLTLPPAPFTPEQVSPTRDTRLRWMQSVLHCTHYVSGASEQDYLRRADAPEIIYVNRDPIERSDEAWTDFPA